MQAYYQQEIECFAILLSFLCFQKISSFAKSSYKALKNCGFWTRTANSRRCTKRRIYHPSTLVGSSPSLPLPPPLSSSSACPFYFSYLAQFPFPKSSIWTLGSAVSSSGRRCRRYWNSAGWPKNAFGNKVESLYNFWHLTYTLSYTNFSLEKL